MSKKSSSYTVSTLTVLILCVIAFSAFTGWLLMLLWNWALVSIFPAAPVLTFYQAWALSIFLSFLGGFFKSSK